MTRDLRLAVRTLVRHPGFTGVALATLALGIGANTAVFSIVDGVLLEPLPYPAPDELVTVYQTAPGIDLPAVPMSEALYAYYRAENQVFSDLAVYSRRSMNLTGGETPERVQTLGTSWSLFQILGVPPTMGRTFVEGEDLPDAAPVVVLGQGLWKRSFGADPAIVGKTVQLNGVTREVIGVMPTGYEFPGNVDLWLPLSLDPVAPERGNHSFPGIARLRPGMDVTAAVADMERLMERMPELFPDQYTASLMEQARFAPIVELRKETVIGDISQALWILLGTVGFVLLIACANVANLFLVRAEGRQREVALRTALGASPGDVVGYYMTESMVLAVGGGVLGLALAVGGVSALTALSPVSVPRMGQVNVDPSVLAFTTGVAVLAGLLFGVFPSLRYAAPSLVSSLREGSRSATGSRESHKARSALVILQVAMALVLLVGSGLMARSFWQLRNVDTGFDPEGVLTVRLSLPPAEYPENRAIADFYQSLVSGLAGRPGVTNVGAISGIPLSDSKNAGDVGIEDYPIGPDDLPPVIDYKFVTEGYFGAMGIRIVEGRVIERADHETGTAVVVINRALAQRFWPDRSPLGRRVNTASDLTGDWFTVVGVVESARQLTLEDDPPPVLYFPMLGADETVLTPPAAMTVVVRTQGEPTALLPTIREVIWAMDAGLPLADARTMRDIVTERMSRTSFTMLMLGIAAAVAMLLGTVGIYGVISYAVSQRIREIGVRMALGAPRGAVRLMVVKQGMVLVLVGVGLGLAGALAMSRFLESLLFGVSARDGVTYVIVAVGLTVTALLASYLPARRASTVDPLEALRYE